MSTSNVVNSDNEDISDDEINGEKLLPLVKKELDTLNKPAYLINQGKSNISAMQSNMYKKAFLKNLASQEKLDSLNTLDSHNILEKFIPYPLQSTITKKFLYICGGGPECIIGMSSQKLVKDPIPLSFFNEIDLKEVVVGRNHTICVSGKKNPQNLEDGKVYCFGSNEFGQCGSDLLHLDTPRGIYFYLLIVIKLLSRVCIKSASAGYYCSFLVSGKAPVQLRRELLNFENQLDL